MLDAFIEKEIKHPSEDVYNIRHLIKTSNAVLCYMLRMLQLVQK